MRAFRPLSEGKGILIGGIAVSGACKSVKANLVEKLPEKAIERVKEVTDRRPKSSALRVMLARYYLAAGRNADARRAYEDAKATDPTFTQADFALAQIDVRENRPNDARQLLTSF